MTEVTNEATTARVKSPFNFIVNYALNGFWHKGQLDFAEVSNHFWMQSLWNLFWQVGQGRTGKDLSVGCTK